MSNKIWFLPADFTFLPDGQLALGNVIPDPRRPTHTLASLADYPDIVLPPIATLVEKNQSYSNSKAPSIGVKLFGKAADMAGLSTETRFSSASTRAYSECDYEIRQYNGAFSPTALKAILDLEPVKNHVNGGIFGKSSVYVITGQRIALHSFSVTNERERSVDVSVGAKATAPAGLSTLPVDVGAGVEVSRSDSRKRAVHYETAPGIVFAYRVHVIRPKGTGTNAELFSSRTAFNSGEVQFDGEDDEMEIVAVNKTVLKQDVELPRDYNFYEETIEGSDWEEDESYLHFLSGR